MDRSLEFAMRTQLELAPVPIGFFLLGVDDLSGVFDVLRYHLDYPW